MMGERRSGRHHFSLMEKNIIFTTLFVISLILQLVLSRIQNEYVVVSVYENQEKIQSISSLMNNVGDTVSALSDFRWNYSDKSSLISQLRSNLADSIRILGEIDVVDPSQGRATYLLESAVFTIFKSYQTQLGRLSLLLIDNEIEKASNLYYQELEPCSAYLGQYLQQYLDATIRDGSESFYKVMTLNEKLQGYCLLSTLFCLSSTFVVSLNLARLVAAMTKLAAASASISEGNLSIPDFIVDKNDEIGRTEAAFNDMKSSMHNRLQLLEEKQRIETELHRRETEALELQTLLEREKLQQLRSQINPHFLFNTFNAITYTAQAENARETEKLLSSLALFFRYTLASNDAEVLLSSEIRLLNEYYALICARFGKRIKLKWGSQDELDLTTLYVPSFIIQPLVENAIKHGLSRKEEGGTVDISIRAKAGMLFISVRDDGVGMSAEKLDAVKKHLEVEPKEGSQVGLYNVASRLRLMGSQCGLEIESEEGKGTVITIHFPLSVRSEEDVQDPDS